MDEFDIIKKYFKILTPVPPDVVAGIGDDAAIVQANAEQRLVLTCDTLVAGRHFPEGTAPADIGWKSLAVNLSDLAAMGAQPLWCLMALTIPEAEPSWLREFSAGFKAVATANGIALVGGDTTRGPLSVTVTAIGAVPRGQAMRRVGALAGDLIAVTGSLGDAALALKLLFEPAPAAAAERKSALTLVKGKKPAPAFDPARLKREPTDKDRAFLRERLDRPQPRVRAGLALREMAHAAIDISDGLAGDLNHVLDASGVGAEVWVDRLPCSDVFQQLMPENVQRLPLQLSGGDDYELCVCLAPDALVEARRRLDIPLTVVGRVIEGSELRFLDPDGNSIPMPPHGYRHFT